MSAPEALHPGCRCLGLCPTPGVLLAADTWDCAPPHGSFWPPMPGTMPHPMGPSGLGFEGWHLRPEITFWLESDVFRGLEPCFGVSSHSSELPFPYLEDGSSGPRPSLSPALTLGRLARRDSVTPQVRVQGSYGTRKGSVMVEMQAGRGRVPPWGPPAPWVPDGKCIRAYK